jgi:hypothetical protein
VFILNGLGGGKENIVLLSTSSRKESSESNAVSGIYLTYRKDKACLAPVGSDNGLSRQTHGPVRWYKVLRPFRGCRDSKKIMVSKKSRYQNWQKTPK